MKRVIKASLQNELDEDFDEEYEEFDDEDEDLDDEIDLGEFEDPEEYIQYLYDVDADPLYIEWAKDELGIENDDEDDEDDEEF